MFLAPDAETAFAMAEAQSLDYLNLNPQFRRISAFGAYALGAHHDDLRGAEVWSVLSRSALEPAEYIRQRYSAFEFQPDDEE